MLANTIAATRWERTGTAREILASFPCPEKRPRRLRSYTAVTLKNSIWNASLEIGKWSGKRNEYRHGTYRPPYRRAVILKAKKANLSAKEKEEGRGVMDCIYILMNAIHAPSPLTA